MQKKKRLVDRKKCLSHFHTHSHFIRFIFFCRFQLKYKSFKILTEEFVQITFT